jgi:tetratricopeptide (TPR) repeat protein
VREDGAPSAVVVQRVGHPPGMYLFFKWDWSRADAECRRSLGLNPNFAEAHHFRSYILLAMNRPEEALLEQKRATEIDPFEKPWALGRAYYFVRQYDASIQEFRLRAQSWDARVWVHPFLSKVYGFKGMEKESVQELEQDAQINRGEKAASAAEANRPQSPSAVRDPSSRGRRGGRAVAA